MDFQDIIAKLGDDFLDVPDSDLKVREFLVDKTLPSVVIAIEKLLEEVTRRNLIDYEGVQLAVAADSGALKPNFDPINWLGQYLFRNNPKYAMGEVTPYAKNMKLVSKKLRERLMTYELELNAKQTAEENSRRKEETQKRMMEAVTSHEKERKFDELLINTIKKWSNKLWRPFSNECLSRIEFIGGMEYIFDKSDTELKWKVAPFLDCLEVKYDGQNTNDRIAVADIINAMLPLIKEWSDNEFEIFIKLLSEKIADLEDFNVKKLGEIYYFPNFPETDKKGWIDHLVKVVHEYELQDTHFQETYSPLNLGDDCAKYFSTRMEDDTMKSKEFFEYAKHLIGTTGFEVFIRLITFIKKSTHSSEEVEPKEQLTFPKQVTPPEQITPPEDIEIASLHLPLTGHERRGLIDGISSLHKNEKQTEICSKAVQMIVRCFDSLYGQENIKASLCLFEKVLVSVNHQDEKIYSKEVRVAARYPENDSNFSNLEVLEDSPPFVNSSTETLITIKILGEDGDSIGFLKIAIGLPNKIEESEINFFNDCGNAISLLIQRLNTIQNCISLVLSAKHLILESNNSTEIDAFICIDTDCYLVLNEKENVGNLKLVSDRFLSEKLRTIIETGKECEEENKRIVPVKNTEGVCVALLSINNNSISTEETNYTELVVQLLKDGETVEGENVVLEGEIDEEARRSLFLPKRVLLAVRKELQLIDNKAISEIRSYKNPPKIVHKVIKSVLYIFGYKPKEVKNWNDVKKLINIDLLKAMIAYDPTKIQKKSNIRRAKTILKVIADGKDPNIRGSSPAQTMHNFVVISMALRDAAVESRARHAELFVEINKEEDDVLSAEELAEELENNEDDQEEEEVVKE